MERDSLAAALNRIFRRDNLCLAEIKGLLKQGIHPDKIIRPKDKWPLLSCMSELPEAACGGQRQAEDYIQLYQELIARGASVNKAVRGGETPLSLLTGAWGSRELVGARLLKCLIEAGADPKACKDSPICNLFGFGRMKGEIFGMPMTLQPGTPEYLAFWNSVQLLLESDVNINAFERRGLYNPLLMAAICGSEHSVKKLIELGADPHVTNKDGNTALMYAAGDADGLASIVAGISCVWERRGDTLAVTRLLMANGADASLRNNRGRTALSIALRNECFDVAYELARSLSGQQKLTKIDLKGFKGSAFEKQAKDLSLSEAPKRIPAPIDTSGTAQLASWEATAAEFNGGETQVLFNFIRDGLTLASRKHLYATKGFMSFYISATKSCISRKGAIKIKPSLNNVRIDSVHIVYEALSKNGMNSDAIAERQVAIGSNGFQNTEELITNVREMICEHLKVNAFV